MTFRYLDLDATNGVGEIRLQRPERRNAINDDMLHEIRAAVRVMEDVGSVRVVILSGEGKSFCSGFDLTSRERPAAMTAADWVRHATLANNAFASIWDSRLPFIAAVQGHSLGLGCELAGVCDITIAADDAMFGEPEVRFGAGPMFNVLPVTTTRKAAMFLLLTGEAIDANEAKDLGIVTRVVARERLMDEVRSLALKIRQSPPLSVQLFKKSVTATYEAAGFRAGVDSTVAAFATAYVDSLPMRLQFLEKVEESGLAAAQSWLDEYQSRPIDDGQIPEDMVR